MSLYDYIPDNPFGADPLLGTAWDYATGNRTEPPATTSSAATTPQVAPQMAPLRDPRGVTLGGIAATGVSVASIEAANAANQAAAAAEQARDSVLPSFPSISPMKIGGGLALAAAGVLAVSKRARRAVGLKG